MRPVKEVVAAKSVSQSMPEHTRHFEGSGKQLMPPGILGAILVAEKFIPQFLFRQLALRIVIVLEKKPQGLR